MLQQKKKKLPREKEIRSYKSLSRQICFALDLKHLSVSLHYAQFKNDAKHMSLFGLQEEHNKESLKMVSERNLGSYR